MLHELTNGRAVIIRVGYLGHDEGIDVSLPTALGIPVFLAVYERADAIARYREWLPFELASNPDARRQMDGILTLLILVGQLNLLCTCRSIDQTEPECHADVIAEYLRSRIDELA
jgi:hypothetical protein